MSKQPILQGETVVCSHAKKFINACRIELGMTEAEVVERIIGGYVHSWHREFEIPLDATYATLGTAIRNQLAGSSHVS